MSEESSYEPLPANKMKHEAARRFFSYVEEEGTRLVKLYFEEEPLLASQLLCKLDVVGQFRQPLIKSVESAELKRSYEMAGYHVGNRESRPDKDVRESRVLSALSRE